MLPSGIYNIFVNGKFVCYGPARAGKGHFKVDEYPITKYLKTGKNVIIIEVCGYYSTSFCLQKQPSFLSDEVYSKNDVLLWTGEHFTARVNPYYIQKTQRYSYQRPMIEAYKISSKDTFFIDDTKGTVLLCRVSSGIMLKRDVKYPRFEKITANEISSGTVNHNK